MGSILADSHQATRPDPQRVQLTERGCSRETGGTALELLCSPCVAPFVMSALQIWVRMRAELHRHWHSVGAAS